MKFPGTEMHMVTFTIIAIEVFLLFFQTIYFLQRPQEKQRLWYLILLFLLVQYNIAGGLFPDPNLSLPLFYQNLYSYFTGALMSIYFAFYFYKAFELDKLKFIAYYGGLLYIGLPYIIFFVVPYSLTGDVRLASRLVVVIPLIYGIAIGRAIFVAFREKFNAATEEERAYYREHMAAIYLAFMFWLSLPFVTFFEGSQLMEHSLTNAGFLVMTFSYIRSIVQKSKREYFALKTSENTLLQLNSSLQDTVEEKTNHLEKLIQQKTNTFINLAHELKTPITLSQNYLYDYERKYGSNEELEIIKSNNNKIARDIVNFFDLERFAKGLNMYENNKVTDFSATLELSVKLFSAFSQKKGVRLTSTIESGLYVKADPSAIERIINNLIENAIKYTPSSKAIFVKLASDEHKVLFSVHDEGIGIAKELQQNIFDPYYQVYTKKRNMDGIGMGLSIVKQIVKSLGGKILVESEACSGSKFTIVLDRHSLSNKEMPIVQESGHASCTELSFALPEDAIFDPDRPYIMVVEDNLALLKLLRDKLSRYYNVYVASNGSDALHKLENRIRIDLIISDIMMDAMDGFELYKYVSQGQRYRHLPFIFLTAKSGAQSKIDGLKLGAIDYIEKPFHVKVLKEKVDSILNTLGKQRTALIDQVYKGLNGGETIQPIPINYFDDNCDRYGFTIREKEISKLLKMGITYPEMADELNISIHTVKTHVRHIFEKTGANNKVMLIKVLQKA